MCPLSKTRNLPERRSSLNPYSFPIIAHELSTNFGGDSQEGADDDQDHPLEREPGVEAASYDASGLNDAASEEKPNQMFDESGRPNILNDDKGSYDLILASRKSLSPRRRRCDSDSQRPSKFAEGSMRDRASDKPPSLYTREWEIMDNRTHGQGDELACDAGTERTLPSSMSRFGRALVNAFSSTVIWHGINGLWHDKYREEPGDEITTLEDRKIKAETAYAELKKAGYPGTVPVLDRRTSANISFVKNRDGPDSTMQPDSGIHVDHYRNLAEHKNERMNLDNEAALSLEAGACHATSHLSIQTKTIRLRKPSLKNLKKVKSHLVLPSKRNSLSSITVPSTETNVLDSSPDRHAIKKQPSRKDLQKQVKLSKKVSDLESKLEKARRELQSAMNGAPPVPLLSTSGNLKPFLPGTLSSLPSERILHGRNPVQYPNTEKNQTSEPPEPLKQRPRKSNPLIFRGYHDAQEEDPIVSQTQSSDDEINGMKSDRLPGMAEATLTMIRTMKRKTDDSHTLYHEHGSKGEGREWDDNSPTQGKGSWETMPKLPKQKNGDSPRSSKAFRRDAVASYIAHSPMKAVQRTGSPSKSRAFDSVRVDQAKIVAMRSNPSSTIPFGRHSDDIPNLQKEFPDVNKEQLIKYIVTILSQKENVGPPFRNYPKMVNKLNITSIADHGSISYHNPSTPIFSPPYLHPASKERSHVEIERSAPPFAFVNSSDLAERSADSYSEEEGEDNAMNDDPSLEGLSSPVPRIHIPEESVEQIPEITGILRHEEIFKDDFEWDDDVF